MMKTLTIILFLICYFPVHAGVSFSAFGGATSGSSNSTLTAGYDDQFILNEQIPIDYYFSLLSGRSQVSTSFVEGLSEAQTKTTNYGFNVGATFFEFVSVSYGFQADSINSNAVAAKEYSISPGINFRDFSLSYTYGRRKVDQSKSYLVLGADFRDQIEFVQRSDRFNLGYRFSESFSMSISHTRFMYDKNLESAYLLLSNPNLVSNNGTDMLSQIYSVLDSSTEISGIYNFGDVADLEVSVGKTVDFYNPKSESSDVRLGTMIYQTSYFMWGVGITSTRSSSENTPSRSYDGIISFAF